MKIFISSILLMMTGVVSFAQNWERIIENPDRYLWGEGYGSSIEEADRQALSSLVSKISVSVSSGFRQTESQMSTSRGREYVSSQNHTLNIYSNVILPNTQRVILASGKKCRVARWIRRDELDAMFEDRKARIREYESYADADEKSGQISDALKYHYWAYVLLRSLPNPSEMRSNDGGLLLNSIPKKMDDILGGIVFIVTGHKGNEVELLVTYHGKRVRSMELRYFDGARWIQSPLVRDGTVILRMAQGSPARYLQLWVEYICKSDAQMNHLLYEMIDALDIRPVKKSFFSFKVTR